jgi:hypothetical protein
MDDFITHSDTRSDGLFRTLHANRIPRSPLCTLNRLAQYGQNMIFHVSSIAVMASVFPVDAADLLSKISHTYMRSISPERIRLFCLSLVPGSMTEKKMRIVDGPLFNRCYDEGGILWFASRISCADKTQIQKLKPKGKHSSTEPLLT